MTAPLIMWHATPFVWDMTHGPTLFTRIIVSHNIATRLSWASVTARDKSSLRITYTWMSHVTSTNELWVVLGKHDRVRQAVPEESRFMYKWVMSYVWIGRELSWADVTVCDKSSLPTVLQCVGVRFRVLRSVAICCDVLQSGAVCCSVSQSVSMHCNVR